VDEAVHGDKACRRKVVAIYVAIAFLPGGGHIVDAGALKLEERKCLALVVVLRKLGEFVIDAIDVVGIAVVADVIAVGLAVGLSIPK